MSDRLFVAQLISTVVVFATWEAKYSTRMICKDQERRGQIGRPLSQWGAPRWPAVTSPLHLDPHWGRHPPDLIIYFLIYFH